MTRVADAHGHAVLGSTDAGDECRLVVPSATSWTTRRFSGARAVGRALMRASALVRGWIVQRIAAERSAPTDTAAVVDRLEADVRTLRKLVAS